MITATSNDSGALATSTTTETTPVRAHAEGVDGHPPAPARLALCRQWRTMPPWLMVKLTKTPTE